MSNRHCNQHPKVLVKKNNLVQSGDGVGSVLRDHHRLLPHVVPVAEVVDRLARDELRVAGVAVPPEVPEMTPIVILSSN